MRVDIEMTPPDSEEVVIEQHLLGMSPAILLRPEEDDDGETVVNIRAWNVADDLRELVTVIEGFAEALTAALDQAGA